MSFLPHDRDGTLVGRFSQGDVSAFDALVARHRGHVYSLAYRMTRDREAAEDIAVEAFCEAYRALPRFRPEAKFSTWLHRITVNVCLEHLRHSRRKRQLQETPLEDDLPAAADTAEAAIMQGLVAQALQALQDLPQAQRETLHRFYFDQETCGEIARALQVPRSTVKTRLFYGLRSLRERLGPPSNGVAHVEV